MAAPTDSERGVENRGVPPAWATEPPLWGEPPPYSWQHVRETLEERERPKVYRFARPDGSRYETTWRDASAAQAWASIMGHRYLGDVPRGVEAPPAPRGTDGRGTEEPLSPPPLIQARPRRPPPPPPPPPPPGPPPVPKRRPAPVPPPKPEEYGIIDYLREDFVDTTMKESMPLISEWFGRVGKALQTVPGLQGVGKAYEAIGEIADGLNLVYELIHEVNQAEALEKGGKQVVKRTKPVKRVAERLLKKKYPALPEPARKKAAEILETLFEKYVSDPAIEEGGRKARELDESKDLDKPLWDELKKVLGAPPAVTPATSPAP